VVKALVLAHQGGWDEMLFVALPLGLFAFLLYIANKKAQARLDAEERTATESREAGDVGAE
jgi:hypothetical protein